MTSRNFILAIVLTLLAITGFHNVNYTQCATYTPEIESIYVQGYESEKYINHNFTAFVGATVVFNVTSDTNLLASNYDGLSPNVVNIKDNLYSVSISSDKVIDTQIILKNDSGYCVGNVNFIDKIDKVGLTAPIMVDRNYDNTFVVNYNDDDELKYVGEVEYILTINNQEYTLSSDSPFVKSINSNEIVLNFNSLNQDINQGSLSIRVQELEANVNFEIQDLPLSDVFLLESNELNYLPNTSQVVVNARITKESFADFAVLDDFASIVGVQLIDRGDYDTYAITIDISNKLDNNYLVLSNNTTSGEVLRGVHLKSVTTVTNFEIISEKTNFSPNETITVSAIINNEESLSGNIDWYVNGIKYSTGSNLVLTRSEGGSFTVYAMLNDVQSNTLTLNISYRGGELIIWYVVFVLALLILIGLFIFKKKKKNFYVSSSLIERARKIVPRYESNINNYNRRQFRNLIYDVAVLKDDTYHNFSDTKDFCFERAGRALSSVKNALNKIYKANKQDRQTLLIENSQSIVDNMNIVINSYEEFSKAYPNEKIFVFKNKKKKNKKDKSNIDEANAEGKKDSTTTTDNVESNEVNLKDDKNDSI